jgi:hypothetical protein
MTKKTNKRAAVRVPLPDKIMGLSEWLTEQAERHWAMADNEEDKRDARRMIDAAEHLAEYSLSLSPATKRGKKETP